MRPATGFLSAQPSAGHFRYHAVREQRKPLHAFSSSLIIALQDSSGRNINTIDREAEQIARSSGEPRIIRRSPCGKWNVEGGGSGLRWKRGKRVESLGEMKINCLDRGLASPGVDRRRSAI